MDTPEEWWARGISLHIVAGFKPPPISHGVIQAHVKVNGDIRWVQGIR